MLNKLPPAKTAHCVPTSEIEGLVCSARNAAQVAACMMEFIHIHHGVPDEIAYSVNQAAARAQELYEAFYQQTRRGLRTQLEVAA